MRLSNIIPPSILPKHYGQNQRGSPQNAMRMQITLTEDEFLQMLADYLTAKFGRPVDPANIEDLDVGADQTEFLTCEIEDLDLGPISQVA